MKQSCMTDRFDCGVSMHNGGTRTAPFYFANCSSRMRAAKILLIGFKGLNAEVCKNIVLAGTYKEIDAFWLCNTGVNSVTLLEWEPVSFADLGANFFLSFEDVGKNVGLYHPYTQRQTILSHTHPRAHLRKGSTQCCTTLTSTSTHLTMH